MLSGACYSSRSLRRKPAMRPLYSATVCLFVLVLLAGCASTKVISQQPYTGGKIARPDRIIVHDFAATPDKTASINLASQGGNLQGAIHNAKNTAAKCVYVPPGSYDFGGHISINGVKLIGDGDSSILSAPNSAGASLQLEGTGSGIYSLKEITRIA